MNRAEVLRLIMDFGGPIGPFQDPEEQERSQKEWSTQYGLAALDHLLDLAVHPPSESELKRVSLEDFEYELSRTLLMIGESDPAAFLSRVGPFLKDIHARRTIIEVIGALKYLEGLPWLEPLVDHSDLDEEELVRLVCAIGEIGGNRASALLDRIEHATPSEKIRVHEEISVAKEAARRTMHTHISPDTNN